MMPGPSAEEYKSGQGFFSILFPTASVAEGIRSVPSVYPSLCLSFSTQRGKAEGNDAKRCAKAQGFSLTMQPCYISCFQAFYRVL